VNYHIISRIVLLVAVVLVGLTAIHLIIVMDDLVRTIEPLVRCSRENRDHLDFKRKLVIEPALSAAKD